MEISGIGIMAAFLAGLVSFLSPCVLPLVPGYISFISHQALDDVERSIFSRARLAILGLSFCFVLGFSAVFILLGAGASALGSILLQYRTETNIIGGTIVIIFGLFMTGLIKWSWLQRDVRFHGDVKGGRAFSALLLGIAFGFGWTPCIGPILGAILTVAATSSGQGVWLLAIYSLGLGVPFLLAALFTNWFMRTLKKATRIGPWLQRIAGGLLILMGIAMVTGYLNTLSLWLIQTFPVLGTFG